MGGGGEEESKNPCNLHKLISRAYRSQYTKPNVRTVYIYFALPLVIEGCPSNSPSECLVYEASP